MMLSLSLCWCWLKQEVVPASLTAGLVCCVLWLGLDSLTKMEQHAYQMPHEPFSFSSIAAVLYYIFPLLLIRLNSQYLHNSFWGLKSDGSSKQSCLVINNVQLFFPSIATVYSIMLIHTHSSPEGLELFMSCAWQDRIHSINQLWVGGIKLVHSCTFWCTNYSLPLSTHTWGSPCPVTQFLSIVKPGKRIEDLYSACLYMSMGWTI